MEVIQLPGLVRVDGPGLRSIKECHQDNGLVQFGVQVNTVAIPHGGLQPAEGLTGFSDPLGHLVIDSRVVCQRASQKSKGFHIFELSTVNIDSGSIAFHAGWRLGHDNRFGCTDC
ncbi:unnamed protein product [Schistocephalus solidus]|uniref:Uncharacterized protein n=1 Tax=Schistocephalus solidus TaxID=70667 RepID=A0A183SXF0_SCHSO|nr:unnamed protein product [Schistocephalus solidus]